MYIVFRSLGQTPNRWAFWLLGMHPYLNACKVLPFQMLLPIQQESRQILSYLHLPSASPLNNITCSHLTSVPRQMGYAVLWLAYTPCRQAGSMLTSTRGPIFLPQNSLEVSSNLPLILIQGQETNLSMNEDMDPRSKWKADICCVTRYYTEENCQRYSVSSARCETALFNRSPGCKIYISISKLHVQVLPVSPSFPLVIATATIHSASANVTSNFNLSA